LVGGIISLFFIFALPCVFSAFSVIHRFDSPPTFIEKIESGVEFFVARFLVAAFPLRDSFNSFFIAPLNGCFFFLDFGSRDLFLPSFFFFFVAVSPAARPATLASPQ